MLSTLKWQIACGFTIGCISFAWHVMCAPGAVCAFVKHNKIIPNHFCSNFFIPFLIFPATGAQPAFYIDQASFVKVFFSEFGQPSPQHNGMPFCLRNKLTCSVLICFSGGK